uniref:Gag-like protein n=1 Tax=Bombyx mori TaxID=7091 RepID=A0A8R2M7F4_BOMMO|nr:mucin-5AC-like [Bombyx mori]
MSGGSPPPNISTPGPSRKGHQAIAGSPAFCSLPARPELGTGTDDRPGPSGAARGSPRIGPGESFFPLPADCSGSLRPRKKARSESDRSSSEAKDKRPRIGPSSKSLSEMEGDEAEDNEDTTSSEDSSSYDSESSGSSHSTSKSVERTSPKKKPIPKPRRSLGMVEVHPVKQLRTPPRSPSPAISPIPSVRRRGAPTLSSTVGNLESTRYMDLESTASHPKIIPNPIPSPVPSTSYAAIAATQKPSTTTHRPELTKSPAPGGIRANEAPRRHPPIMVEALPNWSRHMAAIRERLGRVPSVRPYGTGFRFLPASAEEYRVVQAYLAGASSADSAVKWYCYALEEDISARVAIRGLPADTDAAEIINALKELGFPARYARCIRAKRGRPGCVFFVTLDHLSKEGLALEGWRPNRGPAQCHRCQAFGHASTNCHRAVRCVRCAGEHIVADCPRPREGPLTCANCGKGHAAIDKRCVVYRRRARMMGVAIPPPYRKQRRVPAKPLPPLHVSVHAHL